MNCKIFFIGLIFLSVNIFLQAGGGGESQDSRNSGQELSESEDSESGLGGSEIGPKMGTDIREKGSAFYQPRPYDILEALTEAYPESVYSLLFIEGSWSVEVNGRRFYWMNGRMLPEEDRPDWRLYSAYYFRPYTGLRVPVRKYSAEEESRIRQWIDKREKRKIGTNPAYMSSLWGMDSPQEAESTISKIEFLGRNIRVHPRIVSPLNAVERGVLELKQTDDEVSDWLDTIDYYSAYYWRKIAGSPNRSMHSYGLAVDFIPVDYGDKYVYWRWAWDVVDKWWEISHEQRYEIPDKVIQVFENYGFIWGGNWVLFDQIHFEYRPELILLGRDM